MRITEISRPLVPEPEYLAEFIQKNCQPFLTKGRGQYLYRGIRKKYPRAVTIDVRKNREPVDTSKEVHDKLNQMIAERGLTANRSNSVFVLGTRFIGPQFGEFEDVRTVFPIGEFNYTWSSIINDAYYDIETDPGKRERFLEAEKTSDLYLRALKSFKGDDDTLPYAIVSENEIMISCDRILMIDTHFYRNSVYPLMGK